MNIIYVIQDLNKINWDNIGFNCSKNDVNFGIEFLSQMSNFCRNFNIEYEQISLPFLINIAYYLRNGKLNNTFECDFIECSNLMNNCSNSLKRVLLNPNFSNIIVGYYLDLCLLCQNHKEFTKYLKIYKPIITLFEKGGNFVYREKGMSFIQSGLIPLSNWYNKF